MYNRTPLNLLTMTVAMFAILVAAMCAQGQETQTKSPQQSEQDLPSAESVMAKHIQMSGGLEAFDKIKNRVADSTIEILGQGISIDVKTWSARPNKSYVLIDSKITGKIEKGSDGEHFWETGLMSGPVVHQGPQKYMGLRDSTFERFVYWNLAYESAKTLSVAKVDDMECYEIVLTPKKLADDDPAPPVRIFVDNKEYLIRKIETNLELEAGTIPVVAHPEDYKKVDGILASHKMRMSLLGQQRVVTIKNMKHNVEIAADRFEPPLDVKKLIEKAAKKG